MPPPWRHLLLQGKESDGDKFAKVMPRLIVSGKCRRLGNSKLLRLPRKFSNSLKTPGLSIQQEQLIPTRFARQRI